VNRTASEPKAGLGRPAPRPRPRPRPYPYCYALPSALGLQVRLFRFKSLQCFRRSYPCTGSVRRGHWVLAEPRVKLRMVLQPGQHLRRHPPLLMSTPSIASPHRTHSRLPARAGGRLKVEHRRHGVPRVRVGVGALVVDLEIAHLSVKPDVDRRAARAALVPGQNMVADDVNVKVANSRSYRGHGLTGGTGEPAGRPDGVSACVGGWAPGGVRGGGSGHRRSRAFEFTHQVAMGSALGSFIEVWNW